MNKIFISLIVTFSIFNMANAQVTCPSNFEMDSDPSSCGAVVDYDFGVSPDAYNIILLEGLVSGSEFPVGTTHNVVVVEDFSGSTDTCRFDVIISDITPPVFSCQEDFIVSTDNNSCDAIVSYQIPIVTDNCNTGVNVLSQNNTDVVSSGSPYSCDTFPVSHLRVFDLTAMGVTGDFLISSIDIGVGFSNESLPATMKIYTLDGALSYANMTLISENTVNLPYLVSEMFPFPISATIASTATIVVEYIPTKNTLVGYNNTGGQTAPTYVASTGPSCLVTEPTDLATLGETDFSLIMKVNGGNFVMTQTEGLASAATFPLGVTTNTFVATDGAGNSSICSFTITVEDTQSPIIDCPQHITTNVTEGTCSAAVEYDIVVIENCPEFNLEQIAGLASGSQFPLGTTLNTYVVTDNAGNTDTCNFEVNILDAFAPTFTNCPGNITMDYDPDLCGAIVNYEINATDLCSNPVSVVQNSGLPSGFLFPIGTTTVRYTATDAANNSEICEFTVTINGDPSDVPSFTSCPENINIDAEMDCSAIVNFTLPEVSGSCNLFSTEIKQNFLDTVAFSYGCAEVESKHLRIFDLPQMGINTDLAINTLAVGIGYVGSTTTITLNIYTLEGDLEFGNLTLIGTVDKEITPELNNDTIHVALDVTVPANSIMVTEFAVPAHANSATIAGYNFGGQSNDSYYSASSCGSEEPFSLGSVGLDQALIMHVFADYNLAGFEQIAGMPSGSTFPIGQTMNTFAMENDTCSFLITVLDSAAPVISGCEDIHISMDDDCTATIEIPTPTAIDNCELESLVKDHTDGVFEVGTTVVTWTATDVNGNSSVCSFDVTVVDTIIPSLECTNVNITIHGTACDTTYILSPPVANDNCSIDTIYNNLSSDSFFIGETIVEWTAIDMSGNRAICTSIVTVDSDYSPSFENLVIQDILCYGDSTGIIALNLDPQFPLEWSNGSTTDTISNLVAGQYEVTIQINSELVRTYAFEIAEPTEIVQDSVVIENETDNLGNGSINLFVSGGIAPYTYIGNSGDLAAGEYYITVKDANGCESIFGPFTVDNIVGNEDLSVFDKVTILPNPADEFTIINYKLAKANTTNIVIYNVAGQEIWSDSYPASSQNSVRLETKKWAKGLYFIHLQSNGFNTVQKLIVE